MTSQETTCDQPYRYVKFGLMVTGETEEEHLPKLFKTLMALGFCSFEVIRGVPQLGPITFQKRKLKTTGVKVLSNPDTCASLRTLFAWCWKCLGQTPTARYRLSDGKLSEITRSQLENI